MTEDLVRGRRLPHFLIIGAAKAGTTGLHEHLASHPGLVPPSRKEVHYFDHHYHRPLRWYERKFPAGVPGLRFESTPDYLFLPFVPRRVAHVLPGARFVVVLRDPVARAISHYHMQQRWTTPRPDLAAVLAREDPQVVQHLARFNWALRPGRLADLAARLSGPIRGRPVAPRSRQVFSRTYRARGLYAEQLGRWFAHFPRERFFITTSETLWREPEGTVRQLLDWLGVEGMPAEPLRVALQGNYTPPTGPEIDALRESFREPNEHLCELLGWRPEWA
jgi:hypothetical protein